MDGKWDRWYMLPLILLMLAAVHWRRLLVLVVAVAALAYMSGCSTLPPEIIEVRVPIDQPCQVAEPTRPRMDTEHLPVAAKVDVQARAMRAEIDRREAYEGQLRTALRACVAPSTQNAGEGAAAHK